MQDMRRVLDQNTQSYSTEARARRSQDGMREGGGAPSQMRKKAPMSGLLRRRDLRAHASQIACRQGWRCPGCADLLPQEYEIDHRLPFALLGEPSSSLRNYQALCRHCHAQKTRDDNKLIRMSRQEYRRNQRLPCLSCNHLIHKDYFQDHAMVCSGNVKQSDGYWSPATLILDSDPAMFDRGSRAVMPVVHAGTKRSATSISSPSLSTSSTTSTYCSKEKDEHVPLSHTQHILQALSMTGVSP